MDLTILAVCETKIQTAIDAFFYDGEVSKPETYMDIDTNGIARVAITGPTGRRIDKFTLSQYGAVDTGILEQDIKAADNDPAVKAIFMHIDSPGGMVAGTQELYNVILGTEKPVYAFCDGLMASAAYWIAAGADRIYATKTAQIGSIGVVATHVDLSEMYKKKGIKKTYIYNGKYKRIGNDTEELSPEAEAYIRESVDGIYDIFAYDVAVGRQIGADKVKSFESKIFLADEAKGKGLIDEVADLDTAYKKIRQELKIMDIAELKQDYPSLYQAVLDEGRVSVNTDDIMAQGALRERERIIEIRGSAFGGQEDLVETLISGGFTPDEARKKLIADQKGKMAEVLNEIAAIDPGDIGQNADSVLAEPAATSPADAGEKLNQIALKYVESEGMRYTDAFKKASAENKKLYKKYIEGE